MVYMLWTESKNFDGKQFHQYQQNQQSTNMHVDKTELFFALLNITAIFRWYQK